jgi:hypothetical protein
VDRRAHNLKVIGSNPIPATNLKARSVKALAGFFVSVFAELVAKSGRPQNAMPINGLVTHITAYWRVHVTRSAHGKRLSVRQAFRDVLVLSHSRNS